LRRLTSPEHARGRAVDTVLLVHHTPMLVGYRNATTIQEHIDAFERYSRFRVLEYNSAFAFPRGLHRIRPRAVILHYTLFGSGVYRLGGFEDYLRRASPYAIAFFQDEMYYCRKRFAFLDDCAIDCVFTCLEPEQVPAVYGRYTRVPRVETNVPGYVSDTLIAAAKRFARPDAERPVDVGYRGRSLAPHYGRGAQEKKEIAQRFARAAAGSGLVLDLAVDEGARLYGDDWYRFLSSCKAILGVESGASAFDLEDEVFTEYLALLERHGRASIDDLERGALRRWDHNIPYRTISPRHFEAAAFRICQVQYEGRYSGAMQAGVHYIPLRKDFANVDDVIAQLRDPEVRRGLVENAERDLIASGRWGYDRLIDRVDAVLTDAGVDPERSVADAPVLERALAEGARARRLAAGARAADLAVRALAYPVVGPIRDAVRPALRPGRRRSGSIWG
jgi:hypothetical protein